MLNMAGMNLDLIISPISSFEMNKMNLFPALAIPCPLIFLLDLSNTYEIALVATLVKTSFAKGRARLMLFCQNYPVIYYQDRVYSKHFFRSVSQQKYLILN